MQFLDIEIDLKTFRPESFGIPLLLLSFISGAAQLWITRQFAMRARLINFISGVLLLGIGIYDLYVNWSLIQSYF